MSNGAPWPQWNNQRITLYHGTVEPFAQRIVTNGVDVFAGRMAVDFGQGFYTTTCAGKAKEWARQKSAIRNQPPAILRLTLDRLLLSRLRSLVFVHVDQDSSDYWSFIVHNRSGKRLPPLTERDYDVVYGPVAFRWGPEQYETKPGLDQISFHGNRAQDLLRDSQVCTIEVVI